MWVFAFSEISWGGRELIWTAIGAYAIPSMEILGMPADVGSTVFSASSFVTVSTYNIKRIEV